MKNKIVKIIGSGNVSLQHARELCFKKAKIIFEDINKSKVNFLEKVFSTNLIDKNKRIDYLFDCRPAEYRTTSFASKLKNKPDIVLIEKPAFFSEKKMLEYFKFFKNSKIIQNSFRTKHKNFIKLKEIFKKNKHKINKVIVYESIPESKLTKDWMNSKLDLQIDYLPHSLSMIFNLLDLYNVDNITTSDNSLSFMVSNISCTVIFISECKNKSELVVKTNDYSYSYFYPMNCYLKTAATGNGIIDATKQIIFNLIFFINLSKVLFQKIITGELSNYRNFQNTYSRVDKDPCDRLLIKASTQILCLYKRLNQEQNRILHKNIKSNKKYDNIVIGGGRLSKLLINDKKFYGSNLVISRSEIKGNADNIKILSYGDFENTIKHIRGANLIIVGHPMGGTFSDNISYVSDVIAPITQNYNNFDQIIYISSIAARPVDQVEDSNKNFNYLRSPYAYGKRESENYLLNIIPKNKLKILRFPLISYDKNKINYFFTIKLLKIRFIFASPKKVFPVISSSQAINEIFGKKNYIMKVTQAEYLKSFEKEFLIFIPKIITYIICKVFSKIFLRNKYPESLWMKFKIFY